VKVNQEPKSQKPDLELKTVQQWKMNEGNQSTVQRNIINNFSNAVAKPGKLEWKGKIISSEPLKLSWLQGSWVGTMGDYMPLSVLHEDMLHEGLCSVRVRYLGDKQVLFSSQDGVKLDEVIEGNKERLCKIFVTLKPWGDGIAIGKKVVWTRCKGLPLTLWTVDCFRKVLGNTATLVDVDEATLNWEQLEYARLKVCSAVASKVHVCQEMWINDSVYQVSVEEESSFVEPDSFSRWYKEDVVSDSSSSMETKVEDNIHSGDDRWETSAAALNRDAEVGNGFGHNYSDHGGHGSRRSPEVSHRFAGTKGTLESGREVLQEPCMEMESLVQKVPNNTKMVIMQSTTTPEEELFTNVANLQRLEEKCELSLSNALLNVDIL